MAWFKLDDRWHSHRKVIGLSLPARGLWATLASWCASELNGGQVPPQVVRHFGGTPKLVDELVLAGLWEREDDGWQFHDWDQHQPSKEAVLARREATRIRVSRHRNGVTPLPCNAVTNSVGNASPDPSRPVPAEAGETSPRLPELAPSYDVPTSLEHLIRVGFSQRFEKAACAIPNQKALGALVRDLTPWIQQTAPLRKLAEPDLANRVLDGFFASASAKAKSYPPAYLAQNPLEYLNPAPIKSLLPAAVPRVPDGIPPLRHHAARTDEELYPLKYEKPKEE